MYTLVIMYGITQKIYVIPVIHGKGLLAND